MFKLFSVPVALHSGLNLILSQQSKACVCVYLGVCGDVEVDDAVHMWDVQASRRHVCGQQDRARLGLELVKSSETLVLDTETHIRSPTVSCASTALSQSSFTEITNGFRSEAALLKTITIYCMFSI